MDFREYIPANLTPAVRSRQDLERRIADEVAKALIGRGYIIRIFDGEEYATRRTTDPVTIQKALMLTDEDFFFATHWATVHFVYGNDGYDVIHDYSEELGHLIDPIIAKYT
jgi:hypothetical protein